MGLQVATGSYEGNDAPSRHISTCLSGDIRYLRLVDDSHNEDKTKVDSMGAGYFDPIENQVAPPLPTGITFSGPDFIVGDGGGIPTTGNSSGHTYFWVALST